MNNYSLLPKILIIDDLFGRNIPGNRNLERENLCADFLLKDITNDIAKNLSHQEIKKPIAEVVFFRGQKPITAKVGDKVENDIEGTLQMIESGWTNVPAGSRIWSLVLLDLCFYTGYITLNSNKKTLGMPPGEINDERPENYFGLLILEEIQKKFPDLPVIIFSSKPRNQVSRRFTFLGALDFLSRSAEEDRASKLSDLVWHHGLIPDSSMRIVGLSKSLLYTLRAARRVAIDRRNVLIRGETGTGKELIADFINEHGPEKSRGHLIKVNSAGLSPELYASELFGHTIGAFTGATNRRQGRIVEAQGGDLFLDEIGGMPLPVQAGILRVLELKEILPLGSEHNPKLVDVRFIFATNEDIETRTASGEFREDLFYRLRESGSLYLPPLRQRLEDLPLLVETFVRHAEHLNHRALCREIDPDSIDLLLTQPWSGNIRELRNIIFNAVNNYPGVEHLTSNHLQLPTKVHSIRQPVSPEVNGDFDEKKMSISNLLIESISSGYSKPIPFNILNGSLTTYAQWLGELLHAALIATSKPTAEKPQGEISITRAVQLITGDSTIRTTTAADIVKRMLQLDLKAQDYLLKDSVLENAYRTAKRLRGSRQKRRENNE
jgi:DNA-binding NtrC family response regulator